MWYWKDDDDDGKEKKNYDTNSIEVKSAYQKGVKYHCWLMNTVDPLHKLNGCREPYRREKSKITGTNPSFSLSQWKLRNERWKIDKRVKFFSI